MKKLVIIIILIFLSSINSFGNYEDYFPIKDGLRWTYSVKEKKNQFKQSVICKRLILNTKSSDNYYFCFETNSIRKTKYFYKIKNNMMYLAKIKVNWKALPFKFSLIYDPLIPVFPLNNQLREWTWRGKVSYLLFKKKIKVEFKIDGVEKIKTELGEFECLKIVTNINIDNKKEKNIAWYAKGIGLVKFDSPYQKKKIIGFYK